MRANVAAFLLGNQGVILTGYWRRERDSNPRYGVNPYNALAGRPLRPLGHLSALPANRHRVSQLRTSVAPARAVSGALSAPCCTNAFGVDRSGISPWRGDYNI